MTDPERMRALVQTVERLSIENDERISRIKMLESLLRRCLEDYDILYFTDRHGMADQIRAALKETEK